MPRGTQDGPIPFWRSLFLGVCLTTIRPHGEISVAEYSKTRRTVITTEASPARVRLLAGQFLGTLRTLR